MGVLMPGLPSETVNYTFAGGIDEKTDPWVIEAPRLTQLTNGVFTKNGQIRKRFGYALQSKNIQGGGTLGKAVRVGFRKSEQILSDGDNLYSYAPTLAAQSLSPNETIDQVPQLTATRQGIDTGPVSAFDADCNFVTIGNGGFEIYVWTNGNGSTNGDVFVTVRDATSGTTIFRSFQLTTGATFRQSYVVVVGTTAIVVYADASASPQLLKCRRLDLTNPTVWTAAQTLRSDLKGAGSSIDVRGLDDRFLVAYQTNSAAPNLMLASFTAAGAAITNALLSGESYASGYTCISLGYSTVSSEPTLIAYGGTFGTKFAWVSSTTFAITGSINLITASYAAVSAGSVKVDSSSAILVFNSFLIGGTGLDNPCFSYTVAVNSTYNNVTFHQTYNYVITSRPFLSNGRVYALGFYTNGNIAATTIVIDVQFDQNNTVPFHRPVTTIAPRITGGYSGPVRALTDGGIANCPSIGNGQFLTIGLVLRSNVIGALVGMTRILIDSRSANRHQMLELGEDLHLIGGVPSYYDGRGVYEIGFLSFVDTSVMIATPSTSGGAMAAGVYVYSFVYEVTDASGQRHRSATSVQKLVTVGGAGSGSVAFTKISSVQMTTRQDTGNLGTTPIEVVVYRSVVGGTTLYRLSPESTIAALQNGPQFLSWTDTYNDSSAGNGQPLSTNPLIYTTGGVLDNVCPPSATLGVVHRSRLWLAGTDDPRVVWFSKQFVTGEAVAFCDSFTFTLEDRNPITALGSLDDKLVIFTRASIYIVTGDGPTDSGVGNDLSTPQRVASDVGCIEPRSVVLMPDGLMFQSEQGIMILDRSLSVSYIGHPVENSLAARSVITSAIVKPDQNQVVFTNQDAFAVAGARLVFDYVQRAWSTDDLWDSEFSQSGLRIISAARSPTGVYTFVSNTGQVMTERPSSDVSACLDGSHWITLTVGTAWMKLSGLQGFQRIRRLGLLMNENTAHGLSVALSFNYASSAAQTETLTDAQVVGLPRPPLQPMFRIGSQNGASPRCESLQVTLSDSSPGSNPVGTGQGSFFVGLALEIARKPGLRRVGATAKW
jgi:hypothetical protein